MTKALATTNGAAPATIGGFNREAIDTIKATVAKGATDAELEMFLHLANRYGLDPFAKEIWCTKYLKDGQNPATVPATIIVSRDGYLKAAQMDGDFDGIASGVVKAGDDFAFDPAAGSVKHRFGVQRGEILGAWAVVHHKRRRPVACFAEFGEYRGRSPIWQNYPSAMIQKVAEVQALKRQFGLSGLVSKEEIDHQVDDAPDVQRPAPTVQQIAAPAPDVLEGEVVELTPEEQARAEWERANKRLRAIAGRIGKGLGLSGAEIGDQVRDILSVRYEVDSSTKCSADQLDVTATMLDEGHLVLAAPPASEFDDDIPPFDAPAAPADSVDFHGGRAVDKATGEILAAPSKDEANEGQDPKEFADAHTGLLDAMKAAFPGVAVQKLVPQVQRMACRRFAVAAMDQVTAAGRRFLAKEVAAGRFETLQLVEAEAAQ